MEQVELTTGKKPAELDYEELSSDLFHIWEYFYELRQSQARDTPITFLEMKAYSDMTGVILSNFEIKCIKQLDNAFLRECNG